MTYYGLAVGELHVEVKSVVFSLESVLFRRQTDQRGCKKIMKLTLRQNWYYLYEGQMVTIFCGTPHIHRMNLLQLATDRLQILIVIFVNQVRQVGVI